MILAQTLKPCACTGMPLPRRPTDDNDRHETPHYRGLVHSRELGDGLQSRLDEFAGRLFFSRRSMHRLGPTSLGTMRPYNEENNK